MRETCYRAGGSVIPGGSGGGCARRQVPLLLLCLLLGGCGSGAALKGDRHTHLAWHPRFHTAQQGDTLYSIAWSYGQDYRLVARWNGIPPPYIIRPGQRIRVAPPTGWGGEGDGGESSTAHTASGGRTGGGGSASDSRAPVRVHPAVRNPPPPAAPLPPAGKRQRAVGSGKGGEIEWRWPTRGTPRPAASSSGRRLPGIDIVGRRGQPIYAAAPGKVVYSGSGLLGYGKLVILKHDEQFLSAYAHNWELLVREGEQVARGAQIARMGSSGSGEVKLHFEIRHNGKPVDPLRYLPKQQGN